MIVLAVAPLGLVMLSYPESFGTMTALATAPRNGGGGHVHRERAGRRQAGHGVNAVRESAREESEVYLLTRGRAARC